MRSGLVPRVLGVSLAIIALAVIAAGIPLRMGLVKPNHLIGVRFPQSFSSQANWYAINRYGGTALILWGISALAVGALLMLPLRINRTLALLLGLLYPLTIAVPVLLAYRYALRL